MNRAGGFPVVAALVLGIAMPATAAERDVVRIQKLESQLRQLEGQLRQMDAKVNSVKTEVIRLQSDAGSGAALFLFGIICALWAQNTNRNPWVWFFLGLFFNVITTLVMLYKNAQNRKMAPKGT